MNLKKELMNFLQSLDGDELRNLADGSLPEEMAVDAYIASTVPVDHPYVEWVSVKDRLPEIHEEVLLWHYDRVVQGYLSKSGNWMASYDVTDVADDIEVIDRRIVKQGDATDFITHWMPLPDAPKELK